MTTPPVRMSLPRAWLLVLLSLLGFAAFFYALSVPDFLPSSFCLRGAIAVATVLGMSAGYASRHLPTVKKGRIRSNPLVRAIGSMLLAGMFSFYLLMNVAAQFYTRITGLPISQDVVVSGWHAQGHWCGGPVLREFSWSFGLCLSSDWRSRLLPDTRLHLRGIAGPFGVEVQTLETPDGSRLPI